MATDADVIRPTPEEAISVTVIESNAGWFDLDFKELWRYRELLLLLAWRDVAVRYKQTELGIVWVLLQPLLTTGIFAVLFQLLLGVGDRMSPSGVPYFVSTFCAMLPWQLFAESLTRSGTCIIQNASMLQKIYFPRLVLPLSATLGCLVDFAIALLALACLMAFYGVVPSIAVLTLPFFILLALMASMAMGLWLSALSAMYRDFLYVQPFLIRVGMFVSPVIYSTASLEQKLPGWALVIYGLNPMAGAIEGFRWALLGHGQFSPLVIIPSVISTLFVLLSGMWYFSRMEQQVVDVV